MNYSSKEYEFLGRQVAAGKYIGRSACLLMALVTLLLGGIIGYALAPAGNTGEVKVALDAQGGNTGPAGAGGNGLSQEQFNRIIEATNATMADPGNAGAWVQLGNLYYGAGDPPKSIAAYEKALALQPDVPDVLVDCGVMYRELKDYSKALEYFGKALKINPDHQIAMFNTGVVLHYDLQDPAGLEPWRKLAAINPLFKAPNGSVITDLVKGHGQ